MFIKKLKPVRDYFTKGEIALWCISVALIVVSFSFAYYGEMITYLGMTAPMAVFALVSWLKMQKRQEADRFNTGACRSIFRTPEGSTKDAAISVQR